MTHGSRKLLAIHIADTHLLVAEGRKREGRLQITSLKEVPLDPQNPYATLYSRLKPYKNASVRVALPTQDVTHHFLSLPPLRRKDAMLVVRRELEQNISLDLQGLFLDFIIPKGQEESCEYAVLTTQKKAVLSAVSEIQRAGKKPAFMTSPPFGLMAAARNILPDFGNSTCASLHLEETRGLISIFRNGYLTFTRGFALTKRGASGPEKPLEEAVSPLETGDMLTARLVQETNRSLLFFKQYSHGLVVQSLLISGKMNNPEALRDITAEELGITTYLFQPSEEQGPDKISVPAAVAPRDLIKFAVPVGLMALSPEDAANLVPESVLKKGRFFWSRVLVAIFCLALVLGMGLTHLTLSSEETILKDALQSQRLTLRKMRPIIKKIREIGGNRSRYKRLHEFSGLVLNRSPFWAPFWKDISQIIPEKMILTKASFALADPVSQTYHFTLDGTILAPDVNDAQKIYQQFVSLLLASPYVIKGGYSPPEILPVRLGHTTSVEEAGGNPVGALKSKVAAIKQKGASMNFRIHGTLLIAPEVSAP